jgi:hypothetical protein
VAVHHDETTGTARMVTSTGESSVSSLSSSLSSSRTSPLAIDHVLHMILAYVGDFQYLFVGSVNRSFETTYSSLYPSKSTYYNASTIGHAKFCWDHITACTENDNETKDDQRHEVWCSAARYGQIDVVQYLLEQLPPPQGDDDDVSLQKTSWEDLNYDDWKQDLCLTAVKHGQWVLLQWACNEKILVPEKNKNVVTLASDVGRNDKFYFSYEDDTSFYMDDEVAECASYEAAKTVQLEILKWLSDKKKPLYRWGISRRELYGLFLCRSVWAARCFKMDT